MTQEQMRRVLEIGVQLSSERDLNTLLEEVLSCVMELTRCDAGTLYLRDEDTLRFKISRNNTLKNYSNGAGMSPVPLRRENVCALALLERRTIQIDDVYHCADHDFSGPRRYDAQTGYHTQSMLVVPMRSREGADIGVLQLINAMDENGNVCSFAPDMALVLESVASQAAITIQNVRYLNDIKELFQSFVRVMSTAIDERSRYNANHSRRMAQCGERFIGWLNARAAGRGEMSPFSPRQQEELLMSIWLHDIGKVTTPLEVMDKARRLSPLQETKLKSRLAEIWLTKRIDCLEGRTDGDELESFRQSIREAEAQIDSINGAEFVTDGQLAWLDELKQRTYIDQDGRERCWFTDEEYEMLSIRKGTLSRQEQEKMRKHVVMTDKMLSQIKFSPELAHVPEWAAAHHEKLNGKGYPKGLKGEDIPFEVRIITILDIFDALVASDRPYKKAKTVDQAIKILGFGVKDGELDAELTEQFIESRCWEGLYDKTEGEI
ncbi:MAG: GAF domain-containing protein [Oscillospiraceae bacterium]|nr:GAF domain-containing protein [Oscillospiraceae bacterium]